MLEAGLLAAGAVLAVGALASATVFPKVVGACEATCASPLERATLSRATVWNVVFIMFSLSYHFQNSGGEGTPPRFSQPD